MFIMILKNRLPLIFQYYIIPQKGKGAIEKVRESRKKGDKFKQKCYNTKLSIR